jgi:hypothetical protein
MKVLARILAMSMLIAGFSACDDDDDNDNNDDITTFTTTLTGDNEVPANDSDATGTAVVTFNEDTNEMDVSVTYSGMTATAAHIHEGAVGVAGPAIFPLDDLTSPITLNDVELTAEQEADLKAGNYYVNIHSADFPDGEIRGQLTQD